MVVEGDEDEDSEKMRKEIRITRMIRRYLLLLDDEEEELCVMSFNFENILPNLIFLPDNAYFFFFFSGLALSVHLHFVSVTALFKKTLTGTQF